jgi:hypothetical protein
MRTDPYKSLLVLVLLVGCVPLAAAQNMYPVRAALADVPSISTIVQDHSVPLPLLKPVTFPRMAPELAFEVSVNRSAAQATALAGYTAVTTIDAALPDSKQYGDFELRRQYTAPHTLKFKALHFQGDNFVKVNVIGRLLQSEVERQQKDQSSDIAINRRNYKVAYKKTETINGRVVHVFQLKPRAKRPGLFKGHIYVDALTGSLVRAEGRMVKSPSIFIKDIDFRQDYADSGPFTFPVRLHSEARVRLIGRVIVEMTNREYRVLSAPDAITAGLAPSGAATE